MPGTTTKQQIYHEKKKDKNIQRSYLELRKTTLY